jgi:hypothetical protein
MGRYEDKEEMRGENERLGCQMTHIKWKCLSKKKKRKRGLIHTCCRFTIFLSLLGHITWNISHQWYGLVPIRSCGK